MLNIQHVRADSGHTCSSKFLFGSVSSHTSTVYVLFWSKVLREFLHLKFRCGSLLSFCYPSVPLFLHENSVLFSATVGDSIVFVNYVSRFVLSCLMWVYYHVFLFLFFVAVSHHMFVVPCCDFDRKLTCDGHKGVVVREKQVEVSLFTFFWTAQRWYFIAGVVSCSYYWNILLLSNCHSC